MHIGGLALFEGPPPALDEFLAHVARGCTSCRATARSSRVPPLETGRPLWVDDPTFNLDYHVRHTALPRPGDEDALLRARRADVLPAPGPLEAAVGAVAGRGRSSDGVRAASRRPTTRSSTASPASTSPSVLFDLDARGPASGRRRRAVGAAARAVERRARRARAAAARCGRWRGSPRRDRRRVEPERRARPRARGRRRASARSPGRRSTPPPDTPFNVAPGPHRRLAGRARRARRAEGGQGRVRRAPSTTSCSPSSTGALAYFLQSRGRRTEGIELRAAVPVSVRSDDQRGALGNQLTQIMAPLPVFLDDPLARLRVRQGGDGRAEGVAAGARRRRRSPRCRASRRRRSTPRPRG